MQDEEKKGVPEVNNSSPTIVQTDVGAKDGQEKCPKCKILKKKLDAKNIPYQECNDIQIMSEKGIEFTPMTEIDGKLLDYATAVKWVNLQ